MNDSACSSLSFALSAVSTLFVAQGAAAQSCANPQHGFVGSTISGSTCGSNALPEQNHGTIFTPGDDVVFTVSGPYGVTGVMLQGDPEQLFVFVCSGCGVNAECVDSAELDATGFAYVNYPNDGRNYYVVVDGPTAGCHDFEMSVIGPLRHDP